jgi:hypothetical protein
MPHENQDIDKELEPRLEFGMDRKKLEEEAKRKKKKTPKSWKPVAH